MTQPRVRSYSELRRLDTFEERFDYLALKGAVGRSTFGTDRYINQAFYTSREWKHIRTQVIARDLGCDLGLEGWDIHAGIHIHHMNPMVVGDIVNRDNSILDPEFLICATLRTHNAIHYGNERSLLPKPVAERTSGDTKLW